VRFELKIAWKYFRARRKSLARFTSAVAVVGIAAGVASLIIAQALAKGFADEMRDKILANTAHVAVFPKDGAAISNWRQIAEDLRTTDGVVAVMPTAYENAIIIGETETGYAVLKVSNQNNNLKGSQVAVGARLAEKLNLTPGGAAEIVTLENQTPSRVAIVAVFETGLFDYDATWIYVTPEKFAQLRGQPEFDPSILNISVRDIYASEATARQIRVRLGAGFHVVDWQEANRPLFAALSLERKVALAVIALIIFIAALNITTTLALLVNERRFDIGILRTCGARAASVVTIFLVEGLFLGLIGVSAGLILGLTGCFAGNYFRLVSIPAEVYALNYIPLRPEISSVGLTVLTAFFLCLAACLFPALKASRIKPLENLRSQ
jgi:lipoprotein-releasing system permease protein